MYGDIEIVITENGFGGSESSLEDYNRIHYYEKHLEQVFNFFFAFTIYPAYRKDKENLKSKQTVFRFFKTLLVEGVELNTSLKSFF